MTSQLSRRPAGEKTAFSLRAFLALAAGKSAGRATRLIGRGGGHCLVGDVVSAVNPLDAVIVPPLTWHQFRANGGEALGFLCLVNRARDKPQLPRESDLAALRADPAIAAFLDEA